MVGGDKTLGKDEEGREISESFTYIPQSAYSALAFLIIYFSPDYCPFPSLIAP